MDNGLKFLVFEGAAGDAEPVVSELRRCGLACAVTIVATEDAFVDALSNDVAVVLADFNAPGAGAVGALKRIRERGLDVPLIVVSHAVGDELAADCVKQGAEDLVLKGNLGRLAPAIERALEARRLNASCRAAETALRESEARCRRLVENARRELTLMRDAAALLEGADADVNALLRQLVEKIPAAWQHADVAEARLRWGAREITTAGFRETPWMQTTRFASEWNAGDLTVAYQEERAASVEGPFLQEERWLIDSLGEMLGSHFNRRAAERRLRESEALYRAVIERMPGVTYVATLVGSNAITYISPQVSALLGYTPDEMTADPSLWVNSVHADDRAAVLAALDRALTSGDLLHEEYRILRRNGDVVWVRDEARLIREANGQPLCLQGILVDITERKLAEGALREVNQTLTALVAASPMPLTAMDTSHRLTIWNPAAERAYGWRAEEVLGGSLPNVPPERVAEFETMRAQVNQGCHLMFETERARRDGTRVDVIVSAAPLKDAAGRVCGSMGVHVDISDRKRAEEALRRSEEHFRSLIENALDIIAIVDAAGTVGYISPASGATIGFAPEELENRRLFELIHPDDAAQMEAMLKEVLAAAGQVRTSELRLRHKDGRLRCLEASARALVEEGQVLGAIVNARDITARREAEHRAGTEQAFRHAIGDSLLAGVAVIDTNGRQTYVNRAFAQMVGWPERELIGAMPPYVYWPAETHGEIANSFRTMLEQGTGERSVEVRFVRKDATSFDALVVPATVQDGAGVRAGWLMVVHDLTDRKKLEAQLRESQKMEAIGRLAGGVAHDFNNLLTAILGYTEFILDRVEGTPAATDAHEVRKAGESAARLTHQLLAFSRRQMLDPVTLNLNTVVSEMENMLRRIIGEDIDLRPQLAPFLPTVRADRGQIEQILMNLVVNARDAMPNGGALTLASSVVRLVRGQAEEVPPGDYVRLTVADTGCGMNPGTLAHIFEPFFTTKDPGKGTGLGLATVYGIVKQSGGHIDVASDVGRGSAFHIYLPVASGTGALEDTKAQRLGGAGTVMVVEDEAPVRALVKRILTTAGYVVVDSGPEVAAEMARRHGSRIDLLLLDVVMPQKSGPEIAEELRTIHPEAEVLFMTGYTEHAVLERMHDSGAVGVLQKPFTSASLLAKVRDAVRPHLV